MAERKKRKRRVEIEDEGLRVLLDKVHVMDIAAFLGVSHQAVYKWKTVPTQHKRRLSERFMIPIENL